MEGRQIVKINILILILITGDIKSQELEKDSTFYNIEILKKGDGSWGQSTYIILQSYDYNDRTKILPGLYAINNVIVGSYGKKLILKNLIPENNFKIKGRSINRWWSDELSFYLRRGDSIGINFYLKYPEEEFINIIELPPGTIIDTTDNKR